MVRADELMDMDDICELAQENLLTEAINKGYKLFYFPPIESHRQRITVLCKGEPEGYSPDEELYRWTCIPSMFEVLEKFIQLEGI